MIERLLVLLPMNCMVKKTLFTYFAHSVISHFSYKLSDSAWFEVPKVENDATQPEAGFGWVLKIWFDPERLMSWNSNDCHGHGHGNLHQNA